MRRAFLLPLALCVAGSAAGAQAVNVTWKCTVQGTPTPLAVGDAANHAFVTEQVKCTALKGSIGSVKQKDGMATEFLEVKGDNSSGHGYFVENLSSGDKIYYTYTITGTSKDGKMLTGGNKWTAVGGTGKFAGAKGSGGCTGKDLSPAGGTYDCTGSITVGK